MPRDGRGKDEPYGEIFLCSNFLLPLVPPSQSQGLTDVEFPPATGQGIFSTLEDGGRVSFLMWDPPGVAGFAGLRSDWPDYNPLSRAQGEERGWVRGLAGEAKQKEPLAAEAKSSQP